MHNGAEASSRIVRSFASLAAGEAIARGLAFLATLLIAHRLGPALYGIVGVASGLMLYFTQIADAGIELSGVPVVARAGNEVSAIVSATVTIRVAIALLLTLVVIAVGLWVLPQPDGTVLAIYALGLVLTAASPRWVFLGLQRPATVAAARIAGELATLALLFVALRDAGDLSLVPVATIVGGAIGLAIMIAGLRRLNVRPTLSRAWHLSRPLFAAAPHLVGFTLLGLVLFNFDLIFLRFVAGEREAGYYAAAYTFIAFAANLIVAWAQSVMPSLARLSGSPAERNEVYASAIVLGLTVALPASVGGMLTAPALVPFVFGADFLPAVTALQWLLPVVVLAAIREIAVAGLIGVKGGERKLIRVNAWSVVCNVALVLAVVPRYGLVGAAIATVLTEMLRLALAVYFARQHGFIAPPVSRFRKPVAAAVVMVAGLELAGLETLIPRVVAGIGLYAAGLAITGGLRLDGSRRLRLGV